MVKGKGAMLQHYVFRLDFEVLPIREKWTAVAPRKGATEWSNPSKNQAKCQTASQFPPLFIVFGTSQ